MSWLGLSLDYSASRPAQLLFTPQLFFSLHDDRRCGSRSCCWCSGTRELWCQGTLHRLHGLLSPALRTASWVRTESKRMDILNTMSMYDIERRREKLAHLSQFIRWELSETIGPMEPLGQALEILRRPVPRTCTTRHVRDITCVQLLRPPCDDLARFTGVNETCKHGCNGLCVPASPPLRSSPPSRSSPPPRRARTADDRLADHRAFDSYFGF